MLTWCESEHSIGIKTIDDHHKLVFDSLTKLTLVDRDDCIQIIAIVAKLKPEIDSHMVIFLKNWLINHILHEDMKYKCYFLENDIDVTDDLA